jgi:hypothetical protein
MISHALAQQDADAAKLNEVKVVQSVALVAYDESTDGAQPGKEPLYLPTTLVATQRSAILRLGPLPVAAMRRDHRDSELGQRCVESISVIGAIADEASGEVGDEARVEGGSDEPTLVRRSRGVAEVA